MAILVLLSYRRLSYKKKRVLKFVNYFQSQCSKSWHVDYFHAICCFFETIIVWESQKLNFLSIFYPISYLRVPDNGRMSGTIYVNTVITLLCVGFNNLFHTRVWVFYMRAERVRRITTNVYGQSRGMPQIIENSTRVIKWYRYTVDSLCLELARDQKICSR